MTEGCIVEVGSFRGRSTAALCFGVKDGHDAPIYAVEPHADYTGFYGGKFGGEDRAAFLPRPCSTWASPRRCGW